MSKTRQGP